eukprot:m51a1_g4541 hypothetical protein (383) ;mRNA; f:47590-49152
MLPHTALILLLVATLAARAWPVPVLVTTNLVHDNFIPWRVMKLPSDQLYASPEFWVIGTSDVGPRVYRWGFADEQPSAFCDIIPYNDPQNPFHQYSVIIRSAAPTMTQRASGASWTGLLLGGSLISKDAATLGTQYSFSAMIDYNGFTRWWTARYLALDPPQSWQRCNGTTNVVDEKPFNQSEPVLTVVESITCIEGTTSLFSRMQVSTATGFPTAERIAYGYGAIIGIDNSWDLSKMFMWTALCPGCVSYIQHLPGIMAWPRKNIANFNASEMIPSSMVLVESPYWWCQSVAEYYERTTGKRCMMLIKWLPGQDHTKMWEICDPRFGPGITFDNTCNIVSVDSHSHADYATVTQVSFPASLVGAGYYQGVTTIWSLVTPLK